MNRDYTLVERLNFELMSVLIRFQWEKLSERLHEFAGAHPDKVYLDLSDLVSRLHQEGLRTLSVFSWQHAGSHMKVQHTLSVKYRK